MSEPRVTNALRFLTVTIEDCLGCKREHITFPPENNVHLILYKTDNQMSTTFSPLVGITPVVQALKLMCTKEYATAASLQQIPQLHVGEGCVKMTFSQTHLGATNDSDNDSDLDMGPSTSRQALQQQKLRQERKNKRNSSRSMSKHVVSVVRRFDDVRLLDRVLIQINSRRWTEQPIVEFCDIYFVQPQHIPQMLLEFNKINPLNWMKIIQGDSQCFSQFREKGNPFETFAKLFHHQDYERNELLEQLVESCLFNMDAIRLCERRFLLKVFEDVRQIFEYITCMEYTVWFFVPRLHRYILLDGVNVNDFDLSKVRTCIKLVRDKSPCFFEYADHNIMDILFASFQLALAKVGNQTVVFLSQLEKLAEFMSLSYVKAFFMNKMYSKNENTKWICHRYLHRIIEVSQKLQLSVFIEFPRGLTLLPEPRHVIKCDQHYEKDTNFISWKLFEDVTQCAESHIHPIENIM